MFPSDNATPHTAETYDAQVQKTLPYYNSFHNETLNLIKATDIEPRNWLDTGCGTGTFVQKAIAQFPNTHFVLADPSPQMLSSAKAKLAGYSNIEFIEAPTEKLSNLKTQFDVITAIQSHHYSTTAKRQKATQVSFNLLNPKGIYITFENTRPLTPQGTEIGKENWKNFQIRSGRDPATAEAHMKRFGTEYYPITLEEHLALLRKTGFQVVELLWYSYLQAGFYCIK
ncbi:MAG TPA: methyltransferase [Candidatus Acidoferrales bacterium]|nr:methyltransferase [Candidatus Acidoferrales bacterium]